MGARCRKSARRVLSGGRPERAVPTGTTFSRIAVSCGWREGRATDFRRRAALQRHIREYGSSFQSPESDRNGRFDIDRRCLRRGLLALARLGGSFRTTDLRCNNLPSRRYESIDVTQQRAQPSERDDEDIVRRVLQGDTERFRDLVIRYQTPICRFIRNFVPRRLPYEDLAQDVFLAAYANLASFEPRRGRFSTWLFTIARNKCVNACSKLSPELLDESADPVSPTTPDDDLAAADIRNKLDAAIQRLPDEQRAAFVLEELVGLSADAIGVIEGVSPAAIRSRLSRAKARLREELLSIHGEKP